MSRSRTASKCINCDTAFFKASAARGKYCSIKCQNQYQYLSYIERWLSGEEKGWTGKGAGLASPIRRWLHETRGTGCESCGWDERHPVDNKVLTQVDHINGDCHDCRPENLRVLCPNCHSMTPTYGSRNRDSKRIRNYRGTL